MRSIFISYRRSDTPGEAGRLFDDLVKQFGKNTAFMDVAAIEAGLDFRKAIDQSVATCGVLLALVGPDWVTAADEKGGRRLEHSLDFVRLEVASALKRDIPVIPVLVRGARMPRAEELPAEISDLVYRNGVELTHARWKSDVQLLIKALKPLVEESVSPRGPAWLADGAETGELIPRGSGNSSSLDPARVQRIAHELAVHIGPIAEIVVRRAASQCASVAELCSKVAGEIDSPSARDKFLASVR